ncbi:enoyl-CoA hydratase [Glycocaulis albus]|jgi:enoyl-CoA hydratase|uniref:Enoyl-CoA hydratase n=1 Tax=Glycocaulis albus TaxID=1382801 RepID=A0ABQ1XTK2_9PROT|nr:enoyl-CoA hydratase-related protein [Glycocaulis albus]MBV5257983.1 enoyl-CoA hydratase [Synechococcus moorigangaii CMS01]GGH02475.1 enoyl-CoA hydratase [Glycocaulis albus]
MNYSSFALSSDGPIARLTLNRADKRNTMTPAFWRELPDAVNALSDAGGTRVLILDAEGPVFTAGMDISVFSDPNALTTDTAAAREAFMCAAMALQDAFTAFERARFPVIAAMQGPCVGGGVDMVTACDLRYGTKDAWLRIEETNIGMMADVGTLQRLPRLIPSGVALELAYTGETLSPERAEALGLLNGVLPDEAALKAHVDAVAARIASRPPLTIAGIKKSHLYSRDHSVADSLEHVMTLQASIWNPHDIVEAMAARSEKREGKFTPLAPLKRLGRDT